MSDLLFVSTIDRAIDRTIAVAIGGAIGYLDEVCGLKMKQQGYELMFLFFYRKERKGK